MSRLNPPGPENPTAHTYGGTYAALMHAKEAGDQGRGPHELLHLAEAQRRIGHMIEEAVTEARAAGATWQQIGDALGITMQGAQQRYGKTTKTETH